MVFVCAMLLPYLNLVSTSGVPVKSRPRAGARCAVRVVLPLSSYEQPRHMQAGVFGRSLLGRELLAHLQFFSLFLVDIRFMTSQLLLVPLQPGHTHTSCVRSTPGAEMLPCRLVGIVATTSDYSTNCLHHVSLPKARITPRYTISGHESTS
jgi:hypothetical protein